ncbi:MAG: hypothetical protein LC624_05630 [Halobacteriales archaeon]|nr:hypothetical protein [Halobacteriales archaeon]
MPMTQIDLPRAQAIATEHGLRPAKVKGTDVLQFTRAESVRFQTLSWTEFVTDLEQRGLHVYESHGWLKIMK